VKLPRMLYAAIAMPSELGAKVGAVDSAAALTMPGVRQVLPTEDAVIGLGATRHGLIPDGAVLRLARVIGVGRAKELALLNDHVSPAEARAMGLVNWVCAPAELDRTLALILEKARSAAPTATAHTKRLLHESFHLDPRASLEAVLRAQDECTRSWEMDEANRAWREKREARYDQPEDGPSRRG